MTTLENALDLKARYEAAEAAATKAHALHDAALLVRASYDAREPYRLAARRTEEAADRALGLLMEGLRALSRAEVDRLAVRL